MLIQCSVNSCISAPFVACSIRLPVQLFASPVPLSVLLVLFRFRPKRSVEHRASRSCCRRLLLHRSAKGNSEPGSLQRSKTNNDVTVGTTEEQIVQISSKGIATTTQLPRQIPPKKVSSLLSPSQGWVDSLSTIPSINTIHSFLGSFHLFLTINPVYILAPSLHSIRGEP